MRFSLILGDMSDEHHDAAEHHHHPHPRRLGGLGHAIRLADHALV
jgi:hypothetical protein